MARKSGANPGDVIRYDPAPEPMVAVAAIAFLTMLEVFFAVAFVFLLVTSGSAWEGRELVVAGQAYVFQGNSVETQQAEGFLLGAALLTLTFILSLYRKFFLPDVMIVKKRKLKYEDLM